MIAAPPPSLRARLSLAVSIEVVGTEVTAIARGLTTWKNWELSGWGGSLYEELALAGGAAASLGPAATRGGGGQREEGETVFSRTLGADRRFDLTNRTAG